MNRIFFLLVFLHLLVLGCSGAKPLNLGVTEGRLASCPSSPNCVSSQGEDETHKMEPWAYHTSLAQAKEKILDILRSMPRAKVVTVEENYIRAEFTSRLFRFVDDVEFYFDDTDNVINFRSASRVGYSDLGVNRKRMEEIQERFESG